MTPPAPSDPGLDVDDGSEELTCEQLVELVTDYLDGALDRDTEARFLLHASSCPGCEVYFAQFRETIAAMGTLPPESLEPQLRDDLLEAFRGWRS